MLGEDSVRCFDSIQELRWFIENHSHSTSDTESLRQQRLDRLARSRYSLHEVGLTFERYFLEEPHGTHSLGR